MSKSSDGLLTQCGFVKKKIPKLLISSEQFLVGQRIRSSSVSCSNDFRIIFGAEGWCCSHSMLSAAYRHDYAALGGSLRGEGSGWTSLMHIDPVPLSLVER